jgi:hypothetical protein
MYMTLLIREQTVPGFAASRPYTFLPVLIILIGMPPIFIMRLARFSLFNPGTFVTQSHRKTTCLQCGHRAEEVFRPLPAFAAAW